MQVPVEHLREQPVLIGPYTKPDRHWKTEGENTVDEIAEGRRPAEGDLPMGLEQTSLVQREFDLSAKDRFASPIDKLRGELDEWRDRGWSGTSHATRELLEYWSREPGAGAVYSPFFAQREAIETVIYLTEVVQTSHWMVNFLKKLGDDWSRGLTRVALRMATGTGKTMVMACLIAWYAVNRRREHRADSLGLAKNVDRIVVICPGRTILDRLLGLNPRAKGNIYDEWRLVPQKLRRRLNGFQVDIINWEKLQPRTGIAYAGFEFKSGGGRLSRTKAIALAGGEETSQERESLDDMWVRLLGPARARRPERVVVLNDEGHHCWDRRDDQKPGVWMEALHGLRVHNRYELTQAIDLTATPIFINPAHTRTPEYFDGRNPSGLVPWIVSEFALMESMEAGLVKIPQPPRGDNTGHAPALLNLFEANSGRSLDTLEGMSLVRQGADILYEDYKETYFSWEEPGDSRIGRPVLIVVANNKKNARAIFEMLGGGRNKDGILEQSDFSLLSNVPHSGADETDCAMHTILVLSKSNNPETDEHEQIAGGALGIREIGSGATEEELREVLQTVAQPGQKGQYVRCVVSVGMLTEGWDCQRVTHILGYRKFGSQLLCEQTMGRALRRREYENLEDVKRRDNGEIDQRFRAEYATVFGVPFSNFMTQIEPRPVLPPEPKTQVHPVPERVDQYRIWIPDFTGYTLSAPGVGVTLDDERVIETYPVDGQEGREILWVTIAGPIGRVSILKRLVEPRPGAGAWHLAAELALALEEKNQEENNLVALRRRGALFSECLRVVYEWLNHDSVAVTEADLGGEGMRDLARSAIVDAVNVEGKPVRKIGVATDPKQELRSAGDWRSFLTGLKEIVELDRSELNVAACHSKLEADISHALESFPQVAAFVRNHGPERIEVPYKFEGSWAKYVPDFFVRCHTFDGVTPHVVLEGKGRPDQRSEHKGWWTDHWWIPCANAAGAGAGQIWVRREIGSAHEVQTAIESAIREVITP